MLEFDLKHAAPQRRFFKPKKVAGTQSAGRLLPYFLGIATMVAVAVAAKLFWLSNFEYLAREIQTDLSLGTTDRFLLTDDGPFEENHPVAQNILRIYFPGYDRELKQFHPKLAERDEFAVVSVLLDDRREIRVNIPRGLPFELARTATPDALILGSSRSREGIRPDVLAAELPNIKRVINGSVSAASMRTLEVLLDRFIEESNGHRFKLLIIAVDDVSFARGMSDSYRAWRANLRELNKELTWKRTIETAGRRLLQYFPRFELNSAREPKEVAPCPPDLVAEKLSTVRFKERLRWGIAPDDIAAFERLVAKADGAAERVIFLRMPVTEVWRSSVRNFPIEPVVKEVLGDRWIDLSNAKWNLEEMDFFGAKGKPECELDEQHLNPRASIRFTKELAKKIRQGGRFQTSGRVFH